MDTKLTKIQLKAAILTVAFACAAMPLEAQRTMLPFNPFSGKTAILETNRSQDMRALTDGNDMTTVHIPATSKQSILFSTDEAYFPNGINIVAGADPEATPGSFALFGRNSSKGDWIQIAVVGKNISFTAPFTSFSCGWRHSGQSFRQFKLEITPSKSAKHIELAEVQLLGVPAHHKPLDTNGNKKPLVACPNTKDSSCSITYSFDKPSRLKSYSIFPDDYADKQSSPKAWELLGSNDSITWHTLDIRANEGTFNSTGYEIRRFPGKTGTSIDFASVADELLKVIDNKFLRDYHGGKYLVHAWHTVPEKTNSAYNYWWMAHAIDAYTDAYVRTRDKKHKELANDIKKGMYVAYDETRLDLWNSFFDDMEWMNIACLRAFENTGEGKDVWLTEAKQLFNWIWEGWNYDDGSEGGIRWNNADGRGKNSCSNAPAIIGAAKLYQITGEQHYLEKAEMIARWMMTHSRFDDGFIKDSPNNENRGWAFTYNQGTWVGGLLELFRITKNNEYREVAVDLMDKSIDSRWYSPDGIMREQDHSDGGLFKGIYVRYITEWILSGFLDNERRIRYAMYLVENGRSMYECALLKPEMKVMPDWKSRSEISGGRPNGTTDGSYHASVLLSGLALCESIDRLKRHGVLNADYTVKNSYTSKPFRHYRLKITSFQKASPRN